MKFKEILCSKISDNKITGAALQKLKGSLFFPKRSELIRCPVLNSRFLRYVVLQMQQIKMSRNNVDN